ncbi:MAG: LL-diaminopimelate aminotransferase [bacterium]|nr:LL-diaminopimelate aminotransferase [bacterium]
MKTAKRLDNISPYLFMELRNKIAKAKADGIDVISLAIGDPVEATPKSIIDELCKTAYNQENHQYPTDEEKGMLKFREFVTEWYGERYEVKLDPATEIIALIGSKEGVHHFAMAIVDPQDTVLMTDPGYPAYRANIFLAGAKPYNIPILEQNNFLPVLSDISSDVARKAKAFYLNYPNNPTGAVASKKFFAELVEFAKAYDIAICHDNPYSEIVFNKQERLSFLSVEGAKDVGIELNSLSKPYNMTGWRIGMAMGNPDIIAAISKVKENVDSGVFNAIQYAGIKALESETQNIDKILDIYEKRRRFVVNTLNSIGWIYTPPDGTFYLWIPTLHGESSIDFATMLFEKASVVVAAGSSYGKHGEGYIRISLTVSDKRLREAMQRIKNALK